MAYYSISWDEENSAKPFAYAWALAQILLLVSLLLTKVHILNDMALQRPGNPVWMQGYGIVEYICCLTALTLYLQLVTNGIWHRTTADPDDGKQTESLDIEPLNLSRSSQDIAEPPGEPVFGASLEKMGKLDPVETRDDIQWNKILLATCAMATIIISFILMFP